MRALLAIVTLMIGVARAHADPPRPELRRALLTLAVSDPPPRALLHLPRTSHSIDDDLATLVDHASRLASKLVGRGGVGAFVHVENITGDRRAEAAPRVVVLGLSFGAKR